MTVSQRFAPILRAGPVGPAAIGDGTRLRGKHPGGWYYNKTLWAVERTELPVVVRGARINGSGTLRFGRRSSELDAALVLNWKTSADSDPEGWTDHPSYTRIREPGCYAFQIDGGDFSSTITFRVVGGQSGSNTEAPRTTSKT